MAKHSLEDHITDVLINDSRFSLKVLNHSLLINLFLIQISFINIVFCVFWFVLKDLFDYGVVNLNVGRIAFDI